MTHNAIYLQLSVSFCPPAGTGNDAYSLRNIQNPRIQGSTRVMSIADTKWKNFGFERAVSEGIYIMEMPRLSELRAVAVIPIVGQQLCTLVATLDDAPAKTLALRRTGAR